MDKPLARVGQGRSAVDNAHRRVWQNVSSNRQIVSATDAKAALDTLFNGLRNVSHAIESERDTTNKSPASLRRATWIASLKVVLDAAEAGGVHPLDTLPLMSLVLALSDVERGLVSPSFRPDCGQPVDGVGLSSSKRYIRGNVAAGIWCLKQAGFTTKQAAEMAAKRFPRLENVTRSQTKSAQPTEKRIADVFEQTSTAFQKSPRPEDDQDEAVATYASAKARLKERTAEADPDIKRELFLTHCDVYLTIADRLLIDENGP